MSDEEVEQEPDPESEPEPEPEPNPEEVEDEDDEIPEYSTYLGLDLSTRSLKGTLLDDNDFSILCQHQIDFDYDTRYYKTKNGVHRDPPDNGDRAFINPVMWAEALDRLLEKLCNEYSLRSVVTISCGGQPGGCVFWKKGSSEILSSLDPMKTLVAQLRRAFATNESPVWLDSTTTAQCREIENAVGGPMELAKITGSRVFERCAAPQIRKLYQTQPEVYENTERISIPSSWLASILMGAYACIDESDAAGMNLMDLKQKTWSKELLEATAPGLEEKLGKLAPSHAVAGPVSTYFKESVGLHSKCVVIQSCGDMGSNLAGLLMEHGDLGISLGTNDTVFALTKEPQPSLEGQIFPSPLETEDYLVTLTYRNGAVMREDVYERYAEKAWEIFDYHLDKTTPLNGGKIGFYYKDKECLPPVPAGYYHYIIENFNAENLDGLNVKEVENFDKPSEVRAMIEGHILSMRAHAERIGIPSPKRILVTGAANENTRILKLIATIFGCDVYTNKELTDTVSLGAALIAGHGWTCHLKGPTTMSSFFPADKLEESSFSMNLVAPAEDKDLTSKYTLLMKKRMEIEKSLVEKFSGSSN